MSGYAVLTPYLVPPRLAATKAVNLGDGFILARIRELLAPHRADVVASTREPLGDEAIERINATRCLVLAGANQLHAGFAIAPGFAPERIERIRVPIIPFGIGLYGEEARERGLDAAARRALDAIHERIRWSSWRCADTVEWLGRHAPRLAPQALMTGCPVAYGAPLLEGRPFARPQGRVAVTVTERGDFWSRETATIDHAARVHPGRAVLVQHQVFPAESYARRARWWRRVRTQDDLAAYARKRGLEVAAPASPDECLALYAGCDGHLGSRLHAHLHFLSQAKPSWLCAVDGRATGMARTLDFPLCHPRRWDEAAGFDFERVRRQARAHHATMARFRTYVADELLA